MHERHGVMTGDNKQIILCAFPDCWCSQSTELKVEMVALHEKRVRKCLSKVKGTYLMSAFS